MEASENQINRQSGIPLYLQLIDLLSHAIDNHFYRPGDRLPSERELCKRFEVSRITVRQALEELERDGYIQKKHGKGTYVTKGLYQQNLIDLYSFTDEMKKLGKVPASHVLDFQIMYVNDHISKKMMIEKGKKVIKVTRLRFADNEPLMYETTYLPKDIFEYLTLEDLESRSMYSIFGEEYQVVVTKAIDEFTATTMQPLEAKYLNEEVGTPAIVVKRLGYDHDKIVEYTTSIVSSSKFHYRVEISK